MGAKTVVNNGEFRLDTEGIRKLASLYHAIDHPTRMAIMNLIHAHETMSVMEISDKMGLDKEIISQQLGILRRAELVFSTPRSRFRYYSLNYRILCRLRYGLDP